MTHRDSAPRGPEPASLDGNNSFTAPANTSAPPEFPKETSVVFLNGINTTMQDAQAEARLVANATHHDVKLIHAATRGLGRDIETCAEEKVGRSNNPPERAVEREVLAALDHTKMQHDIHFVAHSRGALILQRGLEMAVKDLQKDGWSQEQIEQRVLSHVTVETFGGASTGMPKGVNTVNYVREHDSVANVFGQGHPSMKDRAEIAGLEAATGLLGAGLAAKLAYDHHITHPNGPVKELPAVERADHKGPETGLLENHQFGSYLRDRQPYAPTFDAWQKAVPHRSAEITPEDVQGNVNRLAENGTKLPDVARLQPWDGRAGTGSFVDVNDDSMAQHRGQGSYVSYNVASDLAGVRPDEGRPMRVEANGLVNDAQSTQQLSRA